MKEKYFKRYTEEQAIEKQSVVRIRFTEIEGWEGTEMLIVGVHLGSNSPSETISNIKYNELDKTDQQLFRRHWDVVRGWLTEIEQDEFNRTYRKFCDLVLDTKVEEFDKQSILKLDRNFHVYIHGDRSMLEHQTDSKGKFVKLYYINQLH